MFIFITRVCRKALPFPAINDRAQHGGVNAGHVLNEMPYHTTSTRAQTAITPGRSHKSPSPVAPGAGLEAPATLGREAEIQMPGEEPRYALGRQAIRDEMQEVADEHPDEGEAKPGAAPLLGGSPTSSFCAAPRP